MTLSLNYTKNRVNKQGKKQKSGINIADIFDSDDINKSKCRTKALPLYQMLNIYQNSLQ